MYTLVKFDIIVKLLNKLPSFEDIKDAEFLVFLFVLICRLQEVLISLVSIWKKI